MQSSLGVERFTFISHALRGDGPFRASVSVDINGIASTAGQSYLNRYARESDKKYAGRVQVAWYASPLAQAAARFAGYLATRTPTRTIEGQPLYKAIADDVDGQGNAVDVFWTAFIVEAKARGSMLLLVDMPESTGQSLAQQIAERRAPTWTAIAPERLTDYMLGLDGKFDLAEFSGIYKPENGKPVDCTWQFTRSTWAALNSERKPLAEGDHMLGECPLLIFTEMGGFPCFGPFSAIADVGKRLFNMQSEEDEILRAQTFSLLTMQVSAGSDEQQKRAAAATASETVGTSNLLVHDGSTPSFIAPSDGPATVYMTAMDRLRNIIDEIGLNVATINQQESGIAMQMRFQAINAALCSFSARIEDLERRAWDLTRRWLGFTQAPEIQWPRDFNLADIEQELKVLQEMQSTGMPPAAIAEQKRRIIAVQFGGLDQSRKDEIEAQIVEAEMEPSVSDNVVPIRADPNAEARTAIMRALNG